VEFVIQKTVIYILKMQNTTSTGTSRRVGQCQSTMLHKLCNEKLAKKQEYGTRNKWNILLGISV
jgi:hypothetical protein